MRSSAILAIVVALGGSATATSDDERCGGDAEAMCKAPQVALTAGPTPVDAPAIHANTTYAVAGFAAGKRSYLTYEASVTGEFTLYLGGPPVSAKIKDEHPACNSAATSCMRTATTYVLVAGERYEIELSAVPPGQRVLVRLEAPVEEDRVALR